MPAARARLTASDWTAAALGALRAGGVAAVAVEPLARRLGTTKGSFYWHFPDREALVAAALEHWEHVEADELIALLAPLPTPEGRLRRLLDAAVAEGGGPDLAVLLVGDAEHPLVAAAVERVTRRRVDYVAAQFRAMGTPRGEAGHRALIAYIAYLGCSQLLRTAPGTLPRGRAARSYVTRLWRALEPRQGVRPDGGRDMTPPPDGARPGGTA